MRVPRLRYLFLAFLASAVSNVALTWPPRTSRDLQPGVTTVTLDGPIARWPEHRVPGGLASAADDPSRVYTLYARGVYEIALADASIRFLPSDTIQGPVALATGPQGLLYVADTRRVAVLDRRTGNHVRDFPVAPAPHSIAVTGDGHLVMASVLGTSLLHVFSPTGRWIRSFGSIQELAPEHPARNRVLNRGIVRIGSDGTIYYVSRHSSPPMVRRFSSTGDMLGEFPLEGFAIDLQTAANQRLWTRRPDTDAALDVIADAAVDPETNHLWVSMPGSSEAGVVYEYDTEGVKLAEYRPVHSDGRPVPLVRWIVAFPGRTIIALDDGLYALPRTPSADRTLPRASDFMSLVPGCSLGTLVSADGCGSGARHAAAPPAPARTGRTG